MDGDQPGPPRSQATGEAPQHNPHTDDVPQILPSSHSETASHINPIHTIAHHVRNNESFSRSRTSTAGSIDAATLSHSSEATWQPYSEAADQSATEDFNNAFSTDPTSERIKADLVKRERDHALDELEGWADDMELVGAPMAEGRPVNGNSAAPAVTDTDTTAKDGADDSNPWVEEDEDAALAESTLLGTSAAPIQGDYMLADNGAIVGNGQPEHDFFNSTAYGDDWSQALSSETQPPRFPEGSQLHTSITAAEEHLPAMTSDLDATSGAETVEELQQPLMESEQTEAIPAPAEEANFGEALKEVEDEFEQSPEAADATTDAFGTVFEGSDDWLQAASAGDQKLESKGNGPAWESAFGEAFDDDGFLDEDGLLEDEPAVSPLSQIHPQSIANTYVPANPAPQLGYAPVSSQPSTPALQPPASVFAPTSPIQPRSTDTERKPSHITKFFEDLPTTQRVRKPKQQVVAPPGTQPAPVAAPPTAPIPPQQRSSVPSQPSMGVQLQPPDKLELFPPRPTVSPDGSSYTTKATMQPPSASRFSPAPGASASPSSRYSAAPSSSGPISNARYSPAVPQKDPPRAPPQLQAPQQPLHPQNPQQSPQTLQPPAPPRRQSSSRYSPAPTQPSAPGRSTTSPPSSGYSPIETTNVPGHGPPPALASHRFAPRTSSPLAQPESRPTLDRSTTAPHAPPPPSINSSPESVRSQPVASTTGPPPSLARGPQPKYPPPNRPRTSSPERQASKYAPRAASEDRRASLQDHPVISQASAQRQPPASVPAPVARPEVPFRTRGPSLSDDVEFVPPVDSESLSDPFQRWKGAPKLQWSSGSTMVTHFPKRDLRFGGGRNAPACKCSAGDLKVSKIRELMPVDESVMSFPGPLKAKGKKKELLAWLAARVDSLHAEVLSSSMSLDSRLSERLLLWKLMRIFIEHDGMLSGNPTVENAVRQALVPPQDEALSSSHVRSESTTTMPGQPDGANALAVGEIRRHLLTGDREKAVWHAVDNKLWGHAMLISSTTQGTLWKQVGQEFVRNEVRSAGSDRRSLAAFYSIMAQNFDESVDELVPASARAGFQMMSTASAGGHGQSALEGLNKWQETLSLVMGNRSPQDEYGLVALGKLLRDYGRVEAAHICFLFAPSLVHLGGLDDSQAHFTLLGTEVLKAGGHDLDAILLTEVYEFGLSLRSTATSQNIPHLQAYKLYHAYVLADAGCRTEASQYCDAISTAIKSMTRPSPYYHPPLIARLEDLTQRLSYTPKDSSSWISKPAVGKVSGSVWAKFNSFVAGDDDAASNGSGPHSEGEMGPFAKMPVGTPTISRSASHADLSAFAPMGGAPPTQQASSNSRYAPSYSGTSKPSEAVSPNNTYQPNSYQPSVQTSAPRDIPKASNYTTSPSRSSSYGQSPAAPTFNPYQPHNNHLGISDTASIASSYDPPILQHPGLDQPFGSPSTTFSDRGNSSHGLPHEDMPAIEEESPAPRQENGHAHGLINGFSPSVSSAYEPASASSYAPPEDSGNAYVPYEPTPESPPASAGPNKKKSFMDLDDDDGLAARASSLKAQPSQSSAPAATRAPSEAVRLAAEADAERDRQAKEARKTSGWFNWLGGKKDPNAPTVHKAKLGEENSFYYDADLGRWVNKKDPGSATASNAGTPPPPKAIPKPAGPPTGTPTSLAPPSRSATPARSEKSEGSDDGGKGASGPPLAPPGASGPPSNPPSRPPTSMSNTSSGLDEMMVVGGRRGGAKKGKRRQVVDVMSQT